MNPRLNYESNPTVSIIYVAPIENLVNDLQIQQK